MSKIFPNKPRPGPWSLPPPGRCPLPPPRTLRVNYLTRAYVGRGKVDYIAGIGPPKFSPTFPLARVILTLMSGTPGRLFFQLFRKLPPSRRLKYSSPLPPLLTSSKTLNPPTAGSLPLLRGNFLESLILGGGSWV